MNSQKILKETTLKDLEISKSISEWISFPQYQRLYELAKAYRRLAIILWEGEMKTTGDSKELFPSVVDEEARKLIK